MKPYPVDTTLNIILKALGNNKIAWLQIRTRLQKAPYRERPHEPVRSLHRKSLGVPVGFGP